MSDLWEIEPNISSLLLLYHLCSLLATANGTHELSLFYRKNISFSSKSLYFILNLYNMLLK
uniref:Uncharacterized protein n=1 Tax=Siphoviridae sp. ct0Bp21 TaxID=2825291 RepID=A0A8S5V2R0_9CAUD|nr:MAG TPA: hypothetical protein [Siphoviridae sp. ct0Bp21]